MSTYRCSHKWLFALIIILNAIFLTLWLSKEIEAQTNPLPCCDRWDPGWTNRDNWGPGMMGSGHQQRMRRHRTFMHTGVPPEYRGKTNPHAATPEHIEQGAALYGQQCASCHGPQGMGDGKAASGLNPSPALLAYLIQMPMSVDAYLLWTISEGGQPFGTAMPAFKDVLSADDMWKIIVFMRAGFPPTTPIDQQ